MSLEQRYGAPGDIAGCGIGRAKVGGEGGASGWDRKETIDKDFDGRVADVVVR